MANFPNSNLPQTATYWAAPIGDGYGGYSWEDPIEIPCRWVESVKIDTAVNGMEEVVNIEVQVDRDLDKEGMLLLGTLDDLESGDYNDPVQAGASQILRFDKIPLIKADRFFRMAYLGFTRSRL